MTMNQSELKANICDRHWQADSPIENQAVSTLFCLALEPRSLTRWDVHKYARRAYDLGVRYIGGCCGFEPYHIRAISEEVSIRNQSV